MQEMTAECMALLWADIDFENSRVKINKAIESGSDTIKEPKTEAGYREVPIPTDFLKELRTVKSEPFEAVFKQIRFNRRFSKSSFRKAWLDFMEQLDIINGAIISAGLTQHKTC